MKIPFSAYDFFGYLSGGGIVLAAFETQLKGEWILGQQVIFSQFFVWLVCAYVVGHLLSHLSSVVLEDLFVRRFLGRPEWILLGRKPKSFLGWIFVGYCQPIPEPNRKLICQKEDLDNATEEELKAYSHRAFHSVKGDKGTSERLTLFLSLFGFCRNASLALIVAAICFGISILIRSTVARDRWDELLVDRSIPLTTTFLAGGLFLSIGMFYRYLKFYRHYYKEIFDSKLCRQFTHEKEI